MRRARPSPPSPSPSHSSTGQRRRRRGRGRCTLAKSAVLMAHGRRRGGDPQEARGRGNARGREAMHAGAMASRPVWTEPTGFWWRRGGGTHLGSRSGVHVPQPLHYKALPRYGTQPLGAPVHLGAPPVPARPQGPYGTRTAVPPRVLTSPPSRQRAQIAGGLTRGCGAERGVCWGARPAPSVRR